MGRAPFSVPVVEAGGTASCRGFRAEPLSLMPQHSSCEPAKLFAGAGGRSRVFRQSVRAPSYMEVLLLHITKSSLISVDFSKERRIVFRSKAIPSSTIMTDTKKKTTANECNKG